MITAMATATRTSAAPTGPAAIPLWKRIVKVTAAIALLFMAPMIIAYVVAGADAAAATLMGAVAGVTGATRSGWKRTARVVPLLGVYAVAAAAVGYGWGWVVLMGFVGLAAGIGMPSGYLPALMYAGMVPTMVLTQAGVGDALAAGVGAIAGGAIGVFMARRLGTTAEVPLTKAEWRGHESVSGMLTALVFVAGTSIAVATGMPHGYWVPLTLIVVIPPIVVGDDTRRGRERLVGTVAGLAIVVPLSFIPMPRFAFYLIGFALFVPAFVTMKRSYTYYAFFESAAVVMLVSAGSDMIGTDAARVEASVIAVALVAIAAVGIAWGLRHVSSSDVPKKALQA